MNFFPSLPPPPPPPPSSFSTTENGGMSKTNQPQDSYINANFIGDASTTPSSSSPTSVTSSIVIVSLIVSSAIIISASIYMLLRFLSRRSHASRNDVVMHNNINNISSTNYTALNSLLIFTFGSVNGNITGGDCAVCLSKFEKEEKLRLLPLCCHAFHTRCIDPWLSDNATCPLCRSTVYPTDADVLNKIQSMNGDNIRRVSRSSFRIEIGSISRRSSGNDGGGRRSYSVGSFEYIVDEGYEIPVDYMHVTVGEGLDAEVGGSGRNWLRGYVDRLGSMSFRSSGRFFSGSSRRSDVVMPVDEDLEAINNRAGEDISELFRWISGV